MLKNYKIIPTVKNLADIFENNKDIVNAHFIFLLFVEKGCIVDDETLLMYFKLVHVNMIQKIKDEQRRKMRIRSYTIKRKNGNRKKLLKKPEKKKDELNMEPEYAKIILENYITNKKSD